MQSHKIMWRAFKEYVQKSFQILSKGMKQDILI